MPNSPEPEQRGNMFMRVILENIGAFIACATVIASGSAIMERVGYQSQAIADMKAEQTKIYNKMEAIQGTVTQIQIQQAVQNREQNRK